MTHPVEDVSFESSKLTSVEKSKPFFFQQRRGRLDLRAVSQVDLERVIRDVDVDVLQAFLENITFSNLREEDLRFLTDQLVIKLFRISQMTIEYLLYAQENLTENLQGLAAKYNGKKRSLAKKRKELIELQESSKHLKGELKSKKKGINTLESLLKDASRTRGTIERNKSVSNSRGNVDEYLRFFVTCSDGLCVEFTHRAGLKIWELKADVRRGNYFDIFLILNTCKTRHLHF